MILISTLNIPLFYKDQKDFPKLLGGDRTVPTNFYRSLMRSKLDYGSIVYGSARKSYLKSLDTIHHQVYV